MKTRNAKQFVRKFVPAGVWQLLQRWRFQRAKAKYGKRIVRHWYGTGELQIELSDPLAAGWYDADWRVPPEFPLLRTSRLRPGATVFDCGAHQGIVALMLAHEVGPLGKVVAVEALPYNAEAARRNRDLNACGWLEVISSAVDARDGSLRISQSFNAQTAAASNYGGTIEVPAVTIDTLSKRYGAPDVIYVDVEGMEVDVMSGAAHALAGRPDAFVEVHVGCGLEAAGGSVDRILSHFPEAHYARHVFNETSRTPVPLADADAAMLRDRFFLIATARGEARP